MSHGSSRPAFRLVAPAFIGYARRGQDLRAQAGQCREQARETVANSRLLRERINRLRSGFLAGTGGSDRAQRGGGRPPPSEYTGQLVVPAVPQAAEMGRKMVRNFCGITGLERLADTGQLLVSELVTNAVLHARTSRIRLEMQVRERDLEVAVFDNDERPPVVRATSPDDVGGRGLLLLDKLAHEWGVAERATGKLVWFNLTL